MAASDSGESALWGLPSDQISSAQTARFGTPSSDGSVNQSRPHGDGRQEGALALPVVAEVQPKGDSKGESLLDQSGEELHFPGTTSRRLKCLNLQLPPMLLKGRKDYQDRTSVAVLLLMCRVRIWLMRVTRLETE